MISPAQFAANQANAQHSTGPPSPEEKAASSQNARTHRRLLATAPDHAHRNRAQRWTRFLQCAPDDENLQKKLDRLGRHHTRFEPTFHRSLKELKALQTNRAQKEDAPDQNIARPNLATAPKLKSKNSERSQSAADPDPDPPLTAEEYAQMLCSGASYVVSIGSIQAEQRPVPVN